MDAAEAVSSGGRTVAFCAYAREFLLVVVAEWGGAATLLLLLPCTPSSAADEGSLAFCWLSPGEEDSAAEAFILAEAYDGCSWQQSSEEHGTRLSDQRRGTHTHGGRRSCWARKRIIDFQSQQGGRAAHVMCPSSSGSR